MIAASAMPFVVADEPESVVIEKLPTDGYAYRLSTLIEIGMATGPRNLQRRIGPSQIGFPCQRNLAYYGHDVDAVNVVDQGKLLVGTGVHAALAEIFERYNGRTQRFLVEHEVSYRDVAGTLDLYDKATRTVVDWKTTTRNRLAKYRVEGPPEQYVVQLQIYGAGLREQGYPVEHLVLAFIPVDASLEQMWTWRTEPVPSIAEDAVDAYESLAGCMPSIVKPVPGRYCGFCPFYDPHTTDTDRACPGR